MRVDPAGSVAAASDEIPCARRAAFCAATAPEVFQSIVYQPQIWAPDRFDVSTIHAEARKVFEKLLHRAAETSPPPTSGRVLLLWGEAGSGKTHLMRAFRGMTHESGSGYFSYMQMTAEASNYGSYLLSNLIASLDQPYAPPTIETSSLMRLSTALFDVIPGLSADEREAFRSDEAADIPAAVHDYADRAADDPRLANCDIDVTRAMIYLQRDDPRLKRKVLKWLRCEDLSPYDRAAVGELVPRTHAEHPLQMVAHLGRLMSAVQGAPLVICVDQLEDMFQLSAGPERFRKVVDTLVAVMDAVPTSIVVLSCLEDYYTANRQHLIRSKVDRLEHDPEPVRLTAHRSLEEIESLIARRLDFLYEDAGLRPNADNSTCPFRREHLKPLANLTTRRVLDNCRAHHQRCIEIGAWVEPDFGLSAATGATTLGDPAPPAAPADGTPAQTLPSLEQAWNEFRTSATDSVPEDEAELAGLLAWGIEQCRVELAEGHAFTAQGDGHFVRVRHEAIGTDGGGGGGGGSFLVAVCEKRAQGGGLGRQVDAAQRTANGIPLVLVRSSAFPASPKALVSQQIAKVVAAGGRRVQVEDSDWRTLAALRRFHASRGAEDAFATWQRDSRPLSQLAALRKILALDKLPPPRAVAPAPTPEVKPIAPPVGGGGAATLLLPAKVTLATTPAKDARIDRAPASRDASPAPAAVDPQDQAPLSLGVAKGLNPVPVNIEPHELKQHMAFLGASGSGKTTAALLLIEQLLSRGVPAVLVDRKGDLCRYADPQAWESSDAERAARLRDLRERIDVALFTPGAPDGRPLAIPVVPDGLHQLAPADREQLSGFAAAAMGGMMGYKQRGSDEILRVILTKAIEVLAGAPSHPTVTVKSLQDLVASRDPALMNAVGGYEDKHFRKLEQDLLTLHLAQRRLIGDAAGEPLDIDALLGRGPSAVPGKTRLTIISTQFLGSPGATEFWVAQFLVALDRWRARSPSDRLQAILLLDEADQYLPAIGKPATKAPLESLLRRARSAGLGILLATQSPGDFDYRCRENIRGWLVGRVTQATAINKLKPMFSEARIDAGAKLPGQATGEFYLLRERDVVSVATERSLIETRQLPEQQILELARG